MNPNSLIFYVRHTGESAAFYARLLGRAPVEASPGFAMFALDSGVMLGLWARDDVQPAATPAGGMELAFTVGTAAEVDATHAAWQRDGVPVLQPPTPMDFGYTFTAADPDGHRLRVFAPAG